MSESLFRGLNKIVHMKNFALCSEILNANSNKLLSLLPLGSFSGSITVASVLKER